MKAKFDLGDRVRVRGFYRGGYSGGVPFTGVVIDFNAEAPFGGEFSVELDEGFTTLVEGERTRYAKFHGNVLEGE